MLQVTKTKILISTFAAGILLSGCGGGTTDTTVSTGTSTGYLIDAAVSGAQYETTSGLSGTTNVDGAFKFRNGDKVKFSLGKLVLGESEPATDGLITPKHLIVGDESVPTTTQTEAIKLLLRTLQSLDNDNNTSNGITISESVRASLEGLLDEVVFRDINESELIQLDNTLDLGLDEDYDGYLDVTEVEAESHFETSMNTWENSENYRNRFGQDNIESHDDNGSNEFSISDLAITVDLPLEVKKTLAYMANEERLAYDVYNVLGLQNPDVKQFVNIATKGEYKHIQAVQELIQRYEITDTELSDTGYTTLNYQETEIEDMQAGVYGVAEVQALYDSLMAIGSVSKDEALKVGCMVEVTDINDLDQDIQIAQDANAVDVVATFNMLRDGSYKHYWAFDKAMKTAGYENGCYIAGDTLLSDKNGVYPQ